MDLLRSMISGPEKVTKQVKVQSEYVDSSASKQRVDAAYFDRINAFTPQPIFQAPLSRAPKHHRVASVAPLRPSAPLSRAEERKRNSNVDKSREVAESMRLRGNQAFSLGEFNNAQRYYTLSLDTLPGHRVVHSNRCILHCLQLEPRAALADCASLAIRDGNFFFQAFTRARALFKTDLLAAVSGLESELHIESDLFRILQSSPDALRLVANAIQAVRHKRQTARLEEAVQDIETAIRRRSILIRSLRNSKMKEDQSTKTPVDRALWLQNASADDNISSDESDFDELEPKLNTERLKSTDRQALKDVASDVQTVADKDHGQILATIEMNRREGNQYFSNAHYAQAARSYSDAIVICDTLNDVSQMQFKGSQRSAMEMKVVNDLHASLLVNRSLAYFFNWQPVESLMDAEAACDLQPKLFEAHFRRARALHALEKYTAAMNALEEALTIRPFDRDALALFAQIEKRLNPTDGNRIHAADAAEMVSRWAPQLGSASPVHLPRAGHGDSTEMAISTVSNQHTPTQVHNKTGESKGELDDEFSAILSKSPDDVEALLGRSQAQFARGRYQDALRDATRALQIDQNSARARMRRAVALLAVAELQRATETDDGVVRIKLIKSAITDLETVSLGGDQEANELLTRAKRTLFVAEARKEKLLYDINRPLECNQVDIDDDVSDTSEDSEEFEEQPASRYSFGWY